MNELKLFSKHPGAIQPLVEGAIAAALRSTEVGLQQTEQRLRALEERYSLTTEEFIRRYERDEVQETLELGEWIGEYRMHQRLQEKLERLRGVEFGR